MYYLSSSNSPVKVRIGNHICKGRGLILLVTGPVKINHLSANYTEFIGPLEYQGSTVTNSLSKANVLAKYFSSVLVIKILLMFLS